MPARAARRHADGCDTISSADVAASVRHGKSPFARSSEFGWPAVPPTRGRGERTSQHAATQALLVRQPAQPTVEVGGDQLSPAPVVSTASAVTAGRSQHARRRARPGAAPSAPSLTTTVGPCAASTRPPPPASPTARRSTAPPTLPPPARSAGARRRAARTPATACQRLGGVVVGVQGRREPEGLRPAEHLGETRSKLRKQEERADVNVPRAVGGRLVDGLQGQLGVQVGDRAREREDRSVVAGREHDRDSPVAGPVTCSPDTSTPPRRAARAAGRRTGLADGRHHPHRACPSRASPCATIAPEPPTTRSAASSSCSACPNRAPRRRAAPGPGWRRQARGRRSRRHSVQTIRREMSTLAQPAMRVLAHFPDR